MKFSLKDLILFWVFNLSLVFSLYSQIGIGTTNPNEEALLHIEGNDKGILIPRIFLTDISTLAPISTTTATESLLVYNINPDLGKGFYYWNGSNSWIAMGVGIDQQLGTDDQFLTEDRIVDFNGHSLNFTNNAIVKLNQGELQLTDTPNNALRYAGENTPFAGIEKDGPALYGNAGGILGSLFNGNEVIAMEWDENGSIKFNQYTNGAFQGNPSTLLGINADGEMQTISIEDLDLNPNMDWFKAGTTAAPESISDSIYTLGSVGIGVDNPNATLHLKENSNTSPNSPTILLEHEDIGGQNSIVFKNTNNDGYAFISYAEPENSENNNKTLTIGIKPSDTNPTQDNINLESSGTISYTIDGAKRYIMDSTAILPNESLQYDLGSANQEWKETFSKDVIINHNLEVGNDVKLNAFGNGNKTGTPTHLLAVESSGKVIETALPYKNFGMQFYSYDISPTANPNLSQIIYNTKIAKSGKYTGSLNSSSGLSDMRPNDQNGFVIKMTGYYEVENPGEFQFNSSSNDGVKLFIDGSLVLDDWDTSGMNTTGGSVHLSQGKHKLEFWYYQNTNTPSFDFSWGSNPDGNTGSINALHLTID